MKFILSIILPIYFLQSTLFALNIKTATPSVLYKKCAGCHGKDGKNSAFGRSDIIAGQDAEDLIEAMDFFKNSRLNSKGVTTVMGKQVKSLTQEQIVELAKYISNLGRK